tara:strand:+ start:2351 stop:2914 length:564 start_codon:yes stop_codon:yes gene_type:complete
MTKLKKEFKRKDVERLRNLVTGKYGNKTTIGVGYKKAAEFYEEGDIWEEDGRKWTIKKGIKQNITKLDSAKKAHIMPLLCPECNRIMNHSNHKAFYQIHKKCHDCVTNMETKMMIKGDYDEYTRKIKNDEIDNKIKDFKVWISEKVKENNTFVTEQGDVERWVGKVDQDKVDEHVKSVIDYLEGLKT